MPIWVTAAIIPVALLGGVLLAFNGGARRRNRTSADRLGAEVEYEARHDLIPSLEETLKGYAFRQRETSEPVTPERAGALSARATTIDN